MFINISDLKTYVNVFFFGIIPAKEDSCLAIALISFGLPFLSFNS